MSVVGLLSCKADGEGCNLGVEVLNRAGIVTRMGGDLGLYFAQIFDLLQNIARPEWNEGARILLTKNLVV